jgi:hypothetical protein
LIGDIPSEIGKLVLLTSLDISLNNLSGSIDALEGLVSLIEVNISYNFLTGCVREIPILEKLLNLSPSSFLGNPFSCVTSSDILTRNLSLLDKYSKLFRIATIEIGSSLFISAILVIIIRRYLLRKEVFFNVRGEESFEFTNDSDYELKISTEKEMSPLQEQVLEATENLKDEYIIGRGAHGIVYKAIIGQQVCAVKKLEFGRNKQKRLGITRNEIKVLRIIKHQNLIKYVDYWIGKDYGLVLYEFMENGSLYEILHEKKPAPPLTWNVRCKIAVGIAQGLAYLHYDCIPPIVHRDIKPKNILLDNLVVIKLMGNGKIRSEKVFGVANLVVPKITYAWSSLIFLPSITGPILTKPFNWFFLSRWGQYRHLQISLYSQPKSYYFINTNQTEATVQNSE